jgi:hypothetical protein
MRAPQDEASKASPRAPRRLVRSPVFSCFLQIQDLPSPLLTITLPRFRGAYCARALHPCFATPERGVAERREVRTYSSSRLRGATTALAKRGVPLRPGRRPSALHRGDFRPRDYASSPAGAAAGSASRRARGRTMRSGRVPCLPRRGSRRSLGTPRPAPPSGSPPETPLKERGCESSTLTPTCSQAQNVVISGQKAGLYACSSSTLSIQLARAARCAMMPALASFPHYP